MSKKLETPATSAAVTSAPQVLRQVKLAYIGASATNPRKDFNEEKLKELADSIKVQGIRSPLLVRPVTPIVEAGRTSSKDIWTVTHPTGRALSKNGGCRTGWFFQDFTTEKEARAIELFELVDGERRYRAAESLRLDSVPAIVQALTDTEAREIQLLSFVRENLSDIESARGYQDLMQNHNYTGEQLREKLGLAKATFYGRMSILKATKPVLDALAKGEISQSHVQLLVSVPDVKAQEKLLEDIIDYPMSVRELKQQIEDEYVANLDKAPFDVSATYPSAVNKLPCAECEFRGANAKDKHPGLGLRPNACLSPKCFKSKCEAKQMQTVEGLRGKGVEVLSPAESAKVFPHSYTDRPVGKVFTSLEEWAYTDKGAKPIGQLLGKDANTLKSVKAFHPDGKLHDIYRQADVAALFEKKGIKLTDSSNKMETPEQKAKRLRQEKIKAASLDKIAMAVLTAAAKDSTNALRTVVAMQEQYSGATRVTLDRQKLSHEKAKLIPELNKLKLEPLAALLLEMTMRDYGGRFEESSITDAAQALGVDVKKIRKEVAEEIDAAEKKTAQAKIIADGKKAIGKMNGEVPAKPAKATKGKAKKK